MTILEILVILAFFEGIIVSSSLFMTKLGYNRFQKNMKVGDLCTFFIDNEETNGVIKEINDDNVSIARGDLKSWTIPPYFTRKKRQVYPK